MLGFYQEKLFYFEYMEDRDSYMKGEMIEEEFLCFEWDFDMIFFHFVFLFFFFFGKINYDK